MRSEWFAFVVLCSCAPLLDAQDPNSAQISGFVVDDGTNRPLSRALVVLSTRGGDPLDAVAYTDGRGAFSFTRLPAWEYLLQASLEGYQPGSYGAKTSDSPPEILVLKPGEVRRSMQIRLIAAGSITGHVLDPDGDPVTYAQVELLCPGFSRGKPRFFTIRNAQTEPDGEYRLNGIPPGRYLVMASARGWLGLRIQPEGTPEQPGQEPIYGVQFYPNIDRLTAAARVTVSPGKELEGVDFRLPLRSVVMVTGGVQVPAGCEGQVQVQILQEDVPEQSRQIFATIAGAPEYKFTIPNVIPGSYRLVATSSTQGRFCRGIARAEVGQTADPTLSISLESGTELSGKVTVEGEGPGPNPARVYLVPGDAIPIPGPPPRAVVKADGTFVLSGVLPGIWDIGVEPIPPGAFIKSMRLGDQDVLTEDMVIDSGTSAPLNIVISKRGGVVEGTVTLYETAAAKPVRAVVVLAPSGRFEHVLSFYAVDLADATGHFEFKGLTPGSYKLFAFDRMPGGGPQNPDFLKPYSGAGEPVEVVEGERISRKVHATTAVER